MTKTGFSPENPVFVIPVIPTLPRAALLHDIWQHAEPQSLRRHHNSIFIQLPATN